MYMYLNFNASQNTSNAVLVFSGGHRMQVESIAERSRSVNLMRFENSADRFRHFFFQPYVMKGLKQKVKPEA